MKSEKRKNQIIISFFVILLVIGLFSSCSLIKERTAETGYDFESIPEQTLAPNSGRILKPALYFVQRGSNKLVAELRSIVVNGDESPVKSIVNQLLSGPIDETLLAVAPNVIYVNDVEVSADVANVYLVTYEPLNAKEKFVLKLALANTLADYLNIKYVNVFFNGRSDGFEGYPHPLQGKTSGVWTEIYDEILGRHIASEKDQNVDAQSIGIVIETPLYFLDASGDYLMPEVREITFTQGKYVEKIFEALADGPQNTYVYQPSLSQELAVLNGYEFYEMDGMNCLNIDLNASPAKQQITSMAAERKAYAALVYSLTSFFPELDRIFFTIDSAPVTNFIETEDEFGGMTRMGISESLAGGISLYFKIKDENLLVKVNRMVSQEQVWSANIRLYELMKGPKSSDDINAWPCFPSGIGEADILGTKVYQSTLEVDLSQNFKDQCRDLSANEEMLLVFSMVNTLTDMQGINSVQFLVEGEKTDALAGHLYFKDLFINNPGLEQVDF